MEADGLDLRLARAVESSLRGQSFEVTPHVVADEFTFTIWAQKTRLNGLAGRLVTVWTVGRLGDVGIAEHQRLWDQSAECAKRRTHATRQGHQLASITVAVCNSVTAAAADFVQSKPQSGRAVIEYAVTVDLSLARLYQLQKYPAILGSVYALPGGLRGHVQAVLRPALNVLNPRIEGPE